MATPHITRPVKMITLTGAGDKRQLLVSSEWIPFTEKWRGVAQWLTWFGTLVLTVARATGRGLAVAWRATRRMSAVAIERLTPLAKATLARTSTHVRAGARGLVRTVRHVHGRIRERHGTRRQDLVAPATSNDTLVQTIDRLSWEIHALRSQVRVQQDLLLQLASQRTDRDTDLAWVARVMASAHQWNDDSARPTRELPRPYPSHYDRPALSQRASLEQTAE